MNQSPTSLKTWMTLGRVSNLPTVWTNSLAAALLASSAGALAPPSSLVWILLLVTLSLLYLAGMLLNDLLDADWDQQHDNPRPITLGLVSRQQVRIATLLLLALAGASALVLSQLIEQPHWLLGSVVLLVGCILGYNVLHKKYVHSVWLMGACRSALYLTAAASLAVPPEPIWLCAILLGVYISSLTYLASQEHRNQLISRLPLLLMLSPLALAIYADTLWFWPVLALWLGWLGRHYWLHLANPQRLKVRAFIGAGLAALPLFDALVMAVANQPLGSLFCVLVFFLLPHFQRWIKPT